MGVGASAANGGKAIKGVGGEDGAETVQGWTLAPV
jgi:hypothetical protein